MKLSRLLLTTSLAAAVALPAAAQSRTFSDIDTDGNGSLSLEELVAVFGQDGAARILAKSDSDGDNAVTRDEIRSSDDDENDDDESDDDENDDDESDDDESDDDESDDDSSDSDESDDDSSDESDSSGSDSDESDD